MTGTPLPPQDSSTTDTRVRITFKPAGPILVQGPVVFLDNEGDEILPPPAKNPGIVKLCRCGFSKEKPFCDGSHKR